MALGKQRSLCELCRHSQLGRVSVTGQAQQAGKLLGTFAERMTQIMCVKFGSPVILGLITPVVECEAFEYLDPAERPELVTIEKAEELEARENAAA